MKLLLSENEKPKHYWQWILLGLQHVFAMFGANILVPLVINQTAQQQVITSAMALFASGVGTLIYIIVTKAKVPVYLGSSFAFMGTLGTLFKMTNPSNNGSVFVALFVVGLVYLLLSLVIYFTGIKWIKKILPPIVVGPMIIIIGLSVAGVAINNSGLNAMQWSENYPAWIGIVIALITLITVMFFSILKTSRFKTIPILLGIIIGYIVALIFHYSTNYKIINTDLLTNVKQWVWYPWDKSTFKGIWNIDGKILTIALVSLLPLTFITISEHIGDHINIGQITKRDYLKDPGLSRTLLGDGLATSVSALMGGVPNTTYGENTSVISITRIASVWVTGLAAIIAILIAFIAPVNQLIAMMPKPVMGGVSIVLFGIIAVQGIKVLINNEVDLNQMPNVFIIGIMLILAIGQAVFNIKITIANNFQIQGMALASVVGILLNLLLNNNLLVKIKASLKLREN